jgi:4,5-dihydroxyphthalate decarboxylase
VKPQIGAFRRMVRDVEFDVCELAPTTYIIARAYGAPFVALPIFVVRRFHHAGPAGTARRRHQDAEGPGRQEGRRARLFGHDRRVDAAGLIDEFGVDNSKVTWVVDDEEHVTQLKLPPNVIHAPEGSSLADMMAKGELVRRPSGQRRHRPHRRADRGWKEVEADYPDLLPNAAELEAEYYARTGVYPMHGTIVVKDSVLAEHPWVAKSLYDAFDRAKKEWLAKLDAGRATTGRTRSISSCARSSATIRCLTASRKTARPSRRSSHRLQAGPDPAPHVDGRAVRRSPQALNAPYGSKKHDHRLPRPLHDRPCFVPRLAREAGRAANDPANAPKSLERARMSPTTRSARGSSNGQLKLQKERGSDLTLFSPIAGLMSHHLGNERTSLEWAGLERPGARVTDMYPDNFAPVCQLPQSPRAAQELDSRAAPHRRGDGLRRLQPEPGPERRLLDRHADHRPRVVSAVTRRCATSTCRP